ncbi:MAG: (Fe-S)-binding protein [Polyangiaceae bacterium]|nr:(Fe-S)-binding protein [Polyangiaceae bacterium]
MSPIAMTLLIVGLWGVFLWSARRRWVLMMVGAPTWESRFSPLKTRLKAVWTYAIFQKKMRYYLWAGLAHNLIFLGFSALLLRTLVLWGRGFSPEFNLWLLTPGTFLGSSYAFIKDVFALAVILGASVFIYYRAIRPQKRMALSIEGLVILGIIITMMVTDMLYDGAAQVLNVHAAQLCGGQGSGAILDPGTCDAIGRVIAPFGEPAATVSWHFFPEPGSSAFAVMLEGVSPQILLILAHVGFWTHASLVLIFLNILPYSKHFHIITAVPNVFLGDQTPAGRLRPMAKTTEELLEKVEEASEAEDMNAARIGYARIDHFSWKDIVDFYSCTECGRCTDNCPAALTGKKLSPKQLTLDLRDHLYSLQGEAASGARPASRLLEAISPAPQTQEEEGDEQALDGPVLPEGLKVLETKDLVPEVIDPDVLWACTSCRACEEQCPVNITYVDKIIQMRRHLVTVTGEFPALLNKPFEGMETNGNPWNLSRLDRAAWTEGLEIPKAADHPQAPVLYWVGCAASYDDRAKKTARATALLLKKAGVDFAILAEEESCTGDPARRSGNEYLFSMLAETNVETIRGYQEQGGVKTIITTCPHCFNTLKNEYPDFGAKFEVVHHTDYLMGLVAEKKLVPEQEVQARVAFHDSCYLGRYNDIYDAPRDILRSIRGVEVLEVEDANRKKGLCCGAGGGQMFMEEQNNDRVNVKRTGQLLATGAETIAAACPFCMTMLTDGLKAESKEAEIEMLDVVELLAQACLTPSSEAAQ